MCMQAIVCANGEAFACAHRPPKAGATMYVLVIYALTLATYLVALNRKTGLIQYGLLGNVGAAQAACLSVSHAERLTHQPINQRNIIRSSIWIGTLN